MKLLLPIIAAVLLSSCQEDEVFPEEFFQCSNEVPENSEAHSKNSEFQLLLENIVSSGAPGIQLSITNLEGNYWNGAYGFADLASSVDMQTCQVTRVGSTVKTLTAVSILLLQEDGLLDLREPITNYLSDAEIKGLSNAKESTIEQLLKHSSGIFNYIQNLSFQTESLNDLTKVWQPNELLEHARGADAYFEVGTDVLYSNTNYVLLGMIIEKVTDRPFYQFFEERIFELLGMVFTQFAAEDPVPEGLVRGYVDFYSNFNIINSTGYSGWDYFTADGGLLSNAYDLNLFLRALFNGELLSETSMTQMLSWQEPNEQAEDGFHTAYGLGIFKIETAHGPAYIHSGDAIGYFASMVHFPEQEVTITWTVNGNYGKIDHYTQSKTAMEKIFRTVLEP